MIHRFDRKNEPKRSNPRRGPPPRLGVFEMKPFPLTEAQKNQVAKTLKGIGSIDQEKLASFLDSISLAVGLHESIKAAQGSWRMAVAQSNITEIRDTLDELIRLLKNLDEPTRWLLRSMEGTNQTDAPIISESHFMHDLAGFWNLLSRTIRDIKGWPSGRPPALARRNLAYGVAKALRDCIGVKPDAARVGRFCALPVLSIDDCRRTHREN